MEPIIVHYTTDTTRVSEECDLEEEESDMDTTNTGTSLQRVLTQEYLDSKDTMLENFQGWTREEQTDFIKTLLLQGNHHHHVHASQFFNSISKRDIITLLPKNGLNHIVDTIFSLLDDEKVLLNAQLVSKEWYCVIADGMQWKKMVERKVFKDKIWRALARRRNFMRHLFFRPAPGTSHPKHSYYRMLYDRTVQDILETEEKWIKGDCSVRRLRCRSEAVDPSERGVYCLQFDDEKVVAGLRDNTIKIWDIDTFESQKVFSGHTGSVLCLQYDGNVIISGSSDSTIRVWNIATGELMNTLIHHTEAILHLKFTNDTLIACSKDRTISVWNIVSPKDITVQRVLIGHNSAVNVVEFDEKYIVSASADRSIKVWDTKLCEFRKTLKGHTKGIACLQYNGKLIISGSSDCTIRLWDVESGDCVKILEGHKTLVRCLRFDDKRLVSGDYGGYIKVWDLASAVDSSVPTPACLCTIFDDSGRIFRLQFDDFQIVTGSHEDMISIFDFGPKRTSWDGDMEVTVEDDKQDKVIEDWIEGLWCGVKAALGIGLVHPLSSGDHIVKLTPLSPDMESSPLSLPSCPQPFIELTFLNDESKLKVDLRTPPVAYPSIDGEPYVAKLLNTKLLTQGGSVKTTLEVTLNVTSDKDFDFEPGDAIGIVCPNPSSEVASLLERLKVKGEQVIELKLVGTKGKIPVHLPRKSTFGDLFTHFLDIRTAPKKGFLRLLAEATANPEEKSSLLELCSKEGGIKYEESIRFPSVSILDILLKYPSCQPRVESLLEHLPRLIPRAYSIASSPYISKTSFTVAFNIVHIPAGDGRMYGRLGLCTGWLHQLSKREGFLGDSVDDLVNSFGSVSLSETDKHCGSTEIVFYKRKNHFFRLPTDLSAPIIMVGPGTGVAPFIGFIEHREQQKIQGLEVGPMTLYFGCRHKEKDFLYREKLERSTSMVGGRVLDALHVAFSRDEDQDGVKYVQDLMEKNAASLVTALIDEGGYFYVCGDANNMAKSVREKLLVLIQNVKGFSEKEATEKVGELVSSKRYLQDIWT